MFGREVTQFLNELQERFATRFYVIGGAVRDSLLRGTYNDIDIASPVRPEQLLNSEYRVEPTGIEFGTVTILYNGLGPIEHTTFRREISYDYTRRHPTVQFTNSLVEDAQRRDFTINSLYWNPQEGIVDPNSGLRDLERGIIRFIGNARQRIEEDPVRALRYIRFQLRFSFEGNERDDEIVFSEFTRQLILQRVSAERVRHEIDRISDWNDRYRFLRIASNIADVPYTHNWHRLFEPFVFSIAITDVNRNKAYDRWRITSEEWAAVELIRGIQQRRWRMVYSRWRQIQNHNRFFASDIIEWFNRNRPNRRFRNRDDFEQWLANTFANFPFRV